MPTSKMKWLKRIKANMQCYHCGARKGQELTFHHLDKTTKVADISQMIHHSGYPKAQIREEMKKCRVVCIECHRNIDQNNKKELTVLEQLFGVTLQK